MQPVAISVRQKPRLAHGGGWGPLSHPSISKRKSQRAMAHGAKDLPPALDLFFTAKRSTRNR